MSVTFSLAMMTHNETAELRWLLDALRPGQGVIDEIVVVDDYSDPDCIAAIHAFGAHFPLRFHQRALERNFGAQRNFMKSLCRGELILFLDPDELPSPKVLKGLPRILEMMDELDVDVCELPRLNILIDTEEPVDPRGLDLGAANLSVSWEDQVRILRNRPHLYWTRHLHETVVGYDRGYRFPRSLDYALLHGKTRRRKARQYAFYKTVHGRYVDRFKHSVRKRLGLLPAIEWVPAEPPV